jgi:hypothetical protein
VLKVESIVAALPPDALLPVPRDVQEEIILADAITDQLADDHEEEDLPNQLPDSEEAEAEEEMQNAAEENGTAEEEMQNEIEKNGNDDHGRMPGQLPTTADVGANSNGSSIDYATVRSLAKEKLAALVGTIVTVGTARGGSMSWKVVDSHLPPPEKTVDADFERGKIYGLKNFDIGQHKKSEVLVNISLSISFLDWKSKVDKMNEEIISTKMKVKRFTYEEFLIGLALLIGAAEFFQKGVQLFSISHSSTASDDDDEGPGAEYWPSIYPSPHFEQYMSFSRFKDFRRLLPCIWVDEG